MPWSGPSILPLARSLSNESAMASARGFTVIAACSWSSYRPMRSGDWRTSSRDVTRFRDRHRNAVEWSEYLASRAQLVQRVGNGERAWVHRDRCMQLVLVQADALDRLANELARRDAFP